MNKEKEYELFNTSAPGLTVFLYWGALGVAAGLNAAAGHRVVHWLVWLVLAALPLASTTIHRLSLGPEGVVVSYSVAGFIRRTRAFPLRTSVFGWEQTKSFRGGTQQHLSLRAKATLLVGTTDGFEIGELQRFHRRLLAAQQTLREESPD